ncbi:hypothetical protein HME9302_00529 [Alteripontixanthobacter maritimus]|uniref:Uncharacterized protein n=1 Tax=Alteripontixanthobacter maritimus TaxID=2161824 RepID=A0A369Q4B8_9SPHN|nr:hypothetical protein [Alteripontixanthobacter maritimus]RDC59342.1 hypothetical protein HME9302_00529 [Alteripontixanthobacter maritimus]
MSGSAPLRAAKLHNGSRIRQAGWAVALVACVAGLAGLTVGVNSVKSEVRLVERQIIALEREKTLLETEFQVRANQQQLANWNEVEFGYRAPDAQQYLESERQLAGLGAPRAVGAPAPIRVARAPVNPANGDVGDDRPAPQMVSPLTGKPVTAQPKDSRQSFAERFAAPVASSALEAAQ